MSKKVLLIVSICAQLFTVSAQAKVEALVDLHHWWKAPSEQAALKVIEDAVIKRNANFETFILDNFAEHRIAIIERVGYGYLPAITHWLAGDELIALDKEGLLVTLPEKVNGDQLKNVLYPRVLDEIANDGKISALPVGIHIQNTTFYSRKIYDELNLQPPKSWQDFFNQADKIQAAGYTPIAIGNDSWQVNLLIDAILIDHAGYEAVQAIRYGEVDKEKWQPVLINLFDKLKKIKQYTNPEWADNKWNENTLMVAKAKAAVQVIGDYAEAVMQFNNYQAKKDYFYRLAPGNETTMVYGVDVFALLAVKDEKRKLGQQVLMETVLDPKIQKAYSIKKGGIPVRKDVGISGLSESHALILKKWQNEDIMKVKMSNGNSRLRFKALESIAYDIWMAPEKFSSKEMAQKFITLIDSANQ